MNQYDYLSALEATALLQVRPQTLYAYASRGLVRSIPGAGPDRSRLYARDDLMKLKQRSDARRGHGPVAGAALSWGEPVLESAITGIDKFGPRYRGHVATTLVASRTSFEKVCHLLWTSHFDAPPSEVIDAGLDTKRLCDLVAGDTPPLAVIGLALPMLALKDAARFAASDAAEHERARRIIRRSAALLGARVDVARVKHALAASTVAQTLLRALGARETSRSTEMINAALVLCADHELNVSAFAARVVASAGSDLYATISAALSALGGSRHGGMCDRVEALLSEIGRSDKALAVVNQRAQRGEEIPGFSHPLYKEGDPRAVPLLEAARTHGSKKRLGPLFSLVDAMAEGRREPPTIDMGLVATSLTLGLPPGSAAAIFGIGRMAGWVAHALEQRAMGVLLRPRARYVGP